MITIDVLSKLNNRSLANIDNMTDRYRTENGIYTFPNPSMWVIEKNLYHLLENSVYKEFEKKYKMRPNYLSYDEYGSTIYDKLLMYVNSIQSVEDFDLDVVIIPSYDAIVEMVKDRETPKHISELSSVDW